MYNESVGKRTQYLAIWLVKKSTRACIYTAESLAYHVFLAYFASPYTANDPICSIVAAPVCEVKGAIQHTDATKGSASRSRVSTESTEAVLLKSAFNG